MCGSVKRWDTPRFRSSDGHPRNGNAGIGKEARASGRARPGALPTRQLNILRSSLAFLLRCTLSPNGPERRLVRRGDLVAIGEIVLQKSKVADLRISRENTKRETITDSYNLNRVTEVACEFYVR